MLSAGFWWPQRELAFAELANQDTSRLKETSQSRQKLRVWRHPGPRIATGRQSLVLEPRKEEALADPFGNQNQRYRHLHRVRVTKSSNALKYEKLDAQLARE